MSRQEKWQKPSHPAGREHEAGNQGKQIYHGAHGGHGGKNLSQCIYAAVRIDALTQCIIFISFMNFMVKKAVLCVLCGLSGEKWICFMF